MLKPKHGDERNHRIEVRHHGLSSHEYSASERYCEKCDAWGTVKGLILSHFCPTCEIAFDKDDWDDSDKLSH